MDIGEILARIEAIDWQLAKPGAMALSRGWSREEVASWAVRANDARSHLVAALVDLRTALHKENQDLRRQKVALARENAALTLRITSLAASNMALLDRLHSHDEGAVEPTSEPAALVLRLTEQCMAMKLLFAETVDGPSRIEIGRRLKRLNIERMEAEQVWRQWVESRFAAVRFGRPDPSHDETLAG